MDELFTRYMYYERACQKIKSSTTEALRKFYEKDSYALLKKDKTLDDLESLCDFWNDVSNQDKERFSDSVLRRLYVLNYGRVLASGSPDEIKTDPQVIKAYLGSEAESLA